MLQLHKLVNPVTHVVLPPPRPFYLSGSSFSMVYPIVAPVSGVVVQISPGIPEAIPLWLPPPAPSTNEKESLVVEGGEGIAPVCLLYMTKDTRWASEENIAKTRLDLESKGHNVLVLAAEGPEFDKDFFSSRMEGQVTPEESALLFSALVDGGFARCQEGETTTCELVSDPRGSGVLKALGSGETKGTEAGGVVANVIGRYHDYLEELLNVVWNSHEITSEKMDVWLDFVAMEGSRTAETEEAA